MFLAVKGLFGNSHKKGFEEIFREQSHLAVQSSYELKKLFANIEGENITKRAPNARTIITDFESRGDALVEELEIFIRNTYILKYGCNKTDVKKLGLELDESINYMKKAVVLVEDCGLEETRPEAIELSEIIVETAHALQTALRAFPAINQTECDEILAQIKTLERRADEIRSNARRTLRSEFEQLKDEASEQARNKSQHALMLSKTVLLTGYWGEIFRSLEHVTDHARNAMRITSHILL